jgi:hypothetical protein
LEGELVTSVFTSVDNVEARNGERLRYRISGNISVVLPERNSSRSGTSFTNGEGNCGKNG